MARLMTRAFPRTEPSTITAETASAPPWAHEVLTRGKREFVGTRLGPSARAFRAVQSRSSKVMCLQAAELRFTDQSHLARQLERTLWPLFHLLRGHRALCLQLEHLALLDHREPPRSTNGSRNLVQTPSQFGRFPASPPWH